MNYNAFYKSIYRIVFVYLIGLVLFQFFRCALFLKFSSTNLWVNHKDDLLKAFFFTGFKFDTVVLLYMLVIPFVFAVISAFIPEQKRQFHNFNRNVLLKLSLLFYISSIILLTCNYYYYNFFQTNFDILVFGLFDDDTHAVFYSMWTDYPIIKIVLAWLVAAILLFYLIRKIISTDISHKIPQNHGYNSATILLTIGLFTIGIRGSFKELPIGKDDATISVNSFINTLTMNGIFSLKEACADYYSYRISPDPSSTLSKYKYANVNEALVDFEQKPTLEKSFSDTTQNSDFLKKNPPHVVFCLMESMSNYYLDLHSSSLNLLGELRNQLNECIVFRNFTSGRNNTIHSLEGLMVNTPLTPLCQSSYINMSLESSVAKPFLDNGYETRFITGGKLGWRNVGKFTATQYFNSVEGSANILNDIPNAGVCEWGAYDEFVFQRVSDLLHKAS